MSGSFADVVYWEKQSSRMCALHCVNSLLQAPSFSEYEFNKFSKELDAAERMLWKGGPESENADSTGYYSIGVIEKALERAGNFQVVNVTRSDVWSALLQEISREQGFVFNLRDHWLCVRRVNGRWWNLDSLKDHPDPLSEVETRNYLTTAVRNGYTVFAIRGERALPLPVVRKDKLALNQQLFTVEQVAKIINKPIEPAKPYYPPKLATHATTTPTTTTTTTTTTVGSTTGVASTSGVQGLAEEPGADTAQSEVVSLGVRTKTGKRESRKFHLKKNSVRQVFAWARTLEPQTQSIWRVGPPRVAVDISDKTLEEAGFGSGQELILIQ